MELSLPRWFGLALVLAGLARAALLIVQDPLLGYANQYDMVRTSACTGLYPAVDPEHRERATLEGPLPMYALGASDREACYPSTEAALVSVVAVTAVAMGAAPAQVRLKWIGIFKLGLLALTALLLAYALHATPLASFYHGLVVLLVVGDPAFTLWFNTLYTEFAVLWALYAVIGSLAVIALTGRGWVAVGVLLVAALVALAFSREQFSLLGPALVAAASPWLWRRSRLFAVTVFGIAIVASFLSFGMVTRPSAVRDVNRADAYLGIVMPSAETPADGARILGLPARCEAMSGASWYLQRGESLQEACPEVFALSSLAFLRFVTADPAALARSVARVLPATQAVTPRYLGILEGARGATVDSLPWWHASLLNAWANGMSSAMYAGLVVAGIAAALLALLAALAWARLASDDPPAPLLLTTLLGATVAYALLTTVFGDGLSEASRHFLPGWLAMACLVPGALVVVPACVLQWVREPRANVGPMVAAGVSVVAIAGLLFVALDWARHQPLAIGVLDLPAAREVQGETLALRGWTLDPYGAERVQVRLGPLVREARVDGASPDIAAIFPGYPASARARFSVDIGAAELAQAAAAGELRMRIETRGGSGARTEIDRRRLEWKP